MKLTNGNKDPDTIILLKIAKKRRDTSKRKEA
jgi:hypothetical protein